MFLHEAKLGMYCKKKNNPINKRFINSGFWSKNHVFPPKLLLFSNPMVSVVFGVLCIMPSKYRKLTITKSNLYDPTEGPVWYLLQLVFLILHYGKSNCLSCIDSLILTDFHSNFRFRFCVKIKGVCLENILWKFHSNRTINFRGIYLCIYLSSQTAPCASLLGLFCGFFCIARMR